MSAIGRREFLGTAGAGALAALAGCAIGGTGTPTPAPTPAASTLRVQVENADDTAHDVLFRLRTRSPGTDVAEQFELADVAPGATEAIPPRGLRRGSYELEIVLPPGSRTFRWAGHECPEKLFEVRLSTDGQRVANRCLDE